MASVASGAWRSRTTTYCSEHKDGPAMLVKRSTTRAIRIIDLATDEIRFVDARRGRPTDVRTQAVRRTLKLRWARQRRFPDLTH